MKKMDSKPQPIVLVDQQAKAFTTDQIESSTIWEYHANLRVSSNANYQLDALAEFSNAETSESIAQFSFKCVHFEGSKIHFHLILLENKTEHSIQVKYNGSDKESTTVDLIEGIEVKIIDGGGNQDAFLDLEFIVSQNLFSCTSVNLKVETKGQQPFEFLEPKRVQNSYVSLKSNFDKAPFDKWASCIQEVFNQVFQDNLTSDLSLELKIDYTENESLPIHLPVTFIPLHPITDLQALANSIGDMLIKWIDNSGKGNQENSSFSLSMKLCDNNQSNVLPIWECQNIELPFSVVVSR